MTQQSGGNVPKVRFKSSFGGWVNRKLGDLINLGSGRDYKHLSLGDIPVYGTGGYMLSVNEALSANMDAVGIGRKGTIDKPYILRAPFWTVDTLFYAIPKAENYLDFVYCIFQRIDWKQKDESTGVPSLSKVAINGVYVFSTNTPEQIQIGKYFRELDSLIGLHQRKHDKLVTLKKAMLQKMFPQPGTTTPEIRFKGFEGNWEPCELDEITTKIGSGKTPRGGKTGYLTSGIPLIRSQNIFSDSVNFEGIAFISDETDEEMSNSRVLQNDVLLNITGASIGRSAVYRSGKRANVNQHVCIIRASDNHHSDFIQLNLASTRGQTAIDNSQAGGAREGLNFQQIGKFVFQYPSHTEQQKIGTYFRTLDTLISKHATQLQKLQQIKSACLEKMFV